ncbi:nucleic acid-binding protein [Methanosphaerula palustris]|uniref:Nucleic acid binding OB-fold tRNA/helicase-type n=1 Tax=Methanosphaerula palustris (strain ATCC BAA-1556 / DSM 19958 / E1-9c) TaxID=521011 RepID=B8GF62_METPE|nr:nucleic acid-binding protein [Methanosphaerula palustris]ACL17868.1 nucleic acid binding OB-fold tRNA/helicase-type [Methanosphaerula palustris E1-9c]
MFVSQERLTLLLLLGVIGAVVGINLLITALGPGYFAHPFSSEAHEGDQVSLQGTVSSVAWTGTGSNLLLTVNGTTVFVPAETAVAIQVQKGEEVRIIGTVQVYQGKKEVMVEDSEGIRILSASTGQGRY